MTKHKITAVVVLITVLTLVTRLVRLDLVPPHLSNDEISIAYDAYSITRTLRDEHNHFLPLSFQSHGTYKAPLTIYLTSPLVFFLGNNDYSARLLSAILGGLTVMILGLLIYELSHNCLLALISSLVLSIAPWHIYSSRMLLESNIALFFVVLGIYLLFYGYHQQKNLAIIGSYFSLALSIYAYHTEWGFVPLLILVLWFFYRHDFAKKPISYLGASLFLLTLLPLLIDFLHNLSWSRAGTEIIFKDPYVAQYLANQSLNILQKGLFVVNFILGNYSKYTDLGYMFFNGLNLLPQEDPFQVGLFLAPLLPCFIIGFFHIKKYFPEHTKFIYSWVIISPLVPALTWGNVNNVRNLISVIPYSIIIAVGALVIWSFLRNNLFLKAGAVCLIVVFFVYFLAIYYYHFPYENGVNYQYGYKQIAQYIKPIYSQFDKIVVDPRFGDYNMYSGVPHLYLSYYTNLDPHLLLKRRETPNSLFFDKYEMRPINWNWEIPKPSYLYIVPVSNLPTSEKLKKLTEINLPNHKPAFALFTL